MESVRVIVSVDTEEDNWLPARSGATVENIRELPRFQRLMERLRMRPTYLTAYQVTNTPWAAAVLRDLAADGAAEVAAHLHPWNTPPASEPADGRSTMCRNLPAALQREKLRTLTERHTEVFGGPPKSFRTGRYGFGPDLIGPLLELGYRVDSSVTPYWSWESDDDGPDFRDAPMHQYQLDAGVKRVDAPVTGGPLQEIPLSCGYTRHPFERWHRVDRMLRQPLMRRLHATGIAWRAGAFRRIFLSPEICALSDMLTLSRRLVERGAGYVQLTLHSSTLRPGLTPFTKTASDVNRMLNQIESFVAGLESIATPVPATLAEFAPDA